MPYKTHNSFSQSDYATACDKNASDQVYVTNLRDLLMSPHARVYNKSEKSRHY